MKTTSITTIPFVSTVEIQDILNSLPKEKRSWINFLLTRKGQFLSVSWSRPLKLRKGVGGDFSKSTNAVVRAGITYDNVAAVQDKRETGELPPVNAGLPWGQWKIFPYLIENKGNIYVRLYPSKAPSHQVKTIYLKDGREITDLREIFGRYQVERWQNDEWIIDARNYSARNVPQPDSLTRIHEIVKPITLASEYKKEDSEPECFCVTLDNIVSAKEISD